MTDLDDMQQAVSRAAAFQRYADDNGFGRPRPASGDGVAVTDLDITGTDPSALDRFRTGEAIKEARP